MLYLVLYCDAENYHKLGSLTQQLLIISVSIGGKSRSGLAGFSAQPRKAEIKMSAKLCFFLKPRILLQTHVTLLSYDHRTEVPISC